MALKNLTVSGVKPAQGGGIKKMADGGGLYLEVRQSGAKIWRYRYRIGRKENIFTIGPFGDRADEFTIAQARDARGEAAKLVAEGKHPTAHRKVAVLLQVVENKNTFAATANEWLAMKRKAGLSDHYIWQLEKGLNHDCIPALGPFNMRDITAVQVLNVLRSRADVPQWALHLRSMLSGVFDYAVLCGRVDNNPTYPARRAIGPSAIIRTRPRKSNAWLELHQIPAFIKAVDACEKNEATEKIAVRLLMLTMVRPGELAAARWEEIDTEQARWDVPMARMKMGNRHVVPLSMQALTLLAELHALTGDTPYLFPERNKRRGHREDFKIRSFLWRVIQRAGYTGRLTAHGLRATASTALNDALLPDNKTKRFHEDWVEYQLAHVPRGVRGIYNHAKYLPQRAAMLQAWADMVLPQKRAPLRIAA